MSGPDFSAAAALAETVHARGAYPHRLDGTGLTDKRGTLDAIAAALSFPEHFGRNLDALYDCLTDLAWLPPGEHVLIWIAADTLQAADPRAYLGIRGTLADAERATAAASSRDRSLTVAFTDD